MSTRQVNFMCSFEEKNLFLRKSIKSSERFRMQCTHTPKFWASHQCWSFCHHFILKGNLKSLIITRAIQSFLKKAWYAVELKDSAIHATKFLLFWNPSHQWWGFYFWSALKNHQGAVKILFLVNSYLSKSNVDGMQLWIYIFLLQCCCRLLDFFFGFDLNTASICKQWIICPLWDCILPILQDVNFWNLGC